jgi:hypothetical protein
VPENTVEGITSLYSNKGVRIASKTFIDALCSLFNNGVRKVLYGPILEEDIDSSGPQKHDFVGELGDDVLFNPAGQFGLYLFTLHDWGS